MTVTSFNDDKGSLVACSYSGREDDIPCPRCPKCWACGTRGKLKVARRYTIINAELKAAVKASRPPKVKKVSEEAA